MPFLIPAFSRSSRLAVKYQFLASDPDDTEHELQVDSFNAVQELNDYEVRTNPSTRWTPGLRETN